MISGQGADILLSSVSISKMELALTNGDSVNGPWLLLVEEEDLDLSFRCVHFFRHLDQHP